MRGRCWVVVGACVVLWFGAEVAVGQVEEAGVEPGAEDPSPIGTLALVLAAVGALGTAAFGIVEGLKWTRLGVAGFDQIEVTLGPLLDSLKVAYGRRYGQLLRGQYLGDSRELKRTLRQGVRIGLNESNAIRLARFVGVPRKAKELKEALRRTEAAQRKAAEDVEDGEAGETRKTRGAASWPATRRRSTPASTPRSPWRGRSTPG